MITHYLVIALFVLIATFAVIFDRLARRPGSQHGTVSDFFILLMYSPVGRATVLAGWAWAGYHFFAR